MVCTIFWLCYISVQNINVKGMVMVGIIGLVIAKSFVKMDVVADFYSKPQRGGSRFHSATSKRTDSYSKYAIPLIKHKTETSKGVAEAVKMAGGQAVKKFAREPPTTDKKRKLGPGAAHMQERFVKGKGGKTYSKKLDEDDNGKPVGKKKSSKKGHKRSAIDELLGDDTY
jgi:hypothetical protein